MVKEAGIIRPVIQVTDGQAVSDGAGVRMTRMIGTPKLRTLDPFLMLDFFSSDAAGDYVAGFPNHPQVAASDTVTYMLAGRMRHKDNHGHEGVIEPGGIQWMTGGQRRNPFGDARAGGRPDERVSALGEFASSPQDDRTRLFRIRRPVTATGKAHCTPLAFKVLAGKTSLGTASPEANTHVDARYFDAHVSLTPGASFREPASSVRTLRQLCCSKVLRWLREKA